MFFLESDGTLTGGMSPFLAEAPGGDTLLDVHPTQLQVLFNGRILIPARSLKNFFNAEKGEVADKEKKVDRENGPRHE